jgi:3-oxoadipate enol-lactonase
MSEKPVEAGVATVDGTEVYYELSGDGPWMVLAHGGEGTRIHWWQQVAVFRRHFRCVAYDARGFGASPAGVLPAGTNPFGDDLLALLDHLGVEQACLVGHSMGGLAVSGVAQRHPERVRRLVMSDTPFNFATAALAQWSGQMLVKLADGFDVMAHLYSPGFAEWAPELAYLYQALNRLNRRPEGPSRVEVYQTWRDQPEGDYRPFEVPTLFIVDSEDELTYAALIRETSAAVHGSEVLQIEGAGHSVYAERADIFNEAVLDFCNN